VLLHGDAAFAGQGTAAETLNLADLDGYTVGGTVHVVVNNLIGFTANPQDTSSSRFAADMAKRLPIPIFHVNAEDPDAAVRVARWAVEYRYQFHSDVVVDLIGFRRHGLLRLGRALLGAPGPNGKHLCILSITGWRQLDGFRHHNRCDERECVCGFGGVQRQ